MTRVSIECAVAQAVQRAAAVSIAGELTPQMRNALTLLSLGMTDKEIMSAMGVSKSTLRTYLRTIYGRLGLTGGEGNMRVLAALYARRAGYAQMSREEMWRE